MLHCGISLKPRARNGAMPGLHGLHIGPTPCIRPPSLPLRNPIRGVTLAPFARCRGFRHAARRTQVLSHSDPSTGLPVGPRADRATTPEFTSEQVLAAVLASVDDDKAEDIVQIDLRGRSDVADYMVICSGRSSRQVAAIAEKLADRIKQSFGLVCKMEGKETGDWVLIDTGDVIVHVFRPEVRDFYQLEKMWLPGAIHSAQS